LKYEIKYQPSYSLLEVELKQGEQITGEAGALTYMSPNIDVRTRTRERSILGTLKTSILGGQSLLLRILLRMEETVKLPLSQLPSETS
jgi:uncharacterized protein (AIM24 family)